MNRITSLGAGACIAAAVALWAALPLEAQTIPSPEQVSKEASAASAPQPAAEPPAASQPAPAATEPAAPPLDPLLAQVRQQASLPMRGVAAADREAAKAFYEARTSTLWVTSSGLTPRARHAIAEIAQADDWGLQANAFELPPPHLAGASMEALADAEIKLTLSVLKYGRFARGGRLEPLQVSRNFDQKPSLVEPKDILEAVAASDTPGDYLRSLHPRHQQFHLLRQALLKARSAVRPAPQEKASSAERLPDGPILKPGIEHPHVALLRKRLKVPASGGAETHYDRDVQEAVIAFQRGSGQQPDGIVGARTRAALNGDEAPKAAFGSDEQRIIVNMERWRWVPEHMGEFHVWDNIPEFQMRVVKRGQVVHQAKIIVGRPETQSTLFSANMKYVIFGPEWGVPDSIKIKEILPYLRPTYDNTFFGFGGPSTDTRILQKHNLRVSYNGKPVDASQVDWTQVDIRKYNFIQPSGAGNVLGAVKFRFPNKHDIYMHDTPQRELFEKTVRTFSHGCIRVQNPGRLAEVLLEEDKGWSNSHVRNLMAQGGNVEVTLTKQIPVHLTYFTAMVGEDGQLRSFADIYGHDHRVASALAGRPLPLEPPSVSASTAMPRADKMDRKEARRIRPSQSNDFFSGLFGN